MRNTLLLFVFFVISINAQVKITFKISNTNVAVSVNSTEINSDPIVLDRGNKVEFSIENPSKTDFEAVFFTTGGNEAVFNKDITGETITFKSIKEFNSPVEEPFRVNFSLNDKVIKKAFSLNSKDTSDGKPKINDAVYLPGYIYYDVYQLQNNSNQSLKILRYYFPHYGESDLIDSIKAHPYLSILDTTFLRSLIVTTKKDSAEIQGEASSITGAILASAGNMDVTNLADGFAKFLVERTKLELNIAFFSKMKKYLEDNYILKTLFPQTTDALMVIDDQIYNYSLYLNLLRESFEKDLAGMLSRLPLILEEDKIKDYFKRNPGIKELCLGSLYLADNLLKKTHPGEIIAGYNADTLNALPEIKSTVQILQLLSLSARSKNPATYWVPVDSIREFLNDSERQKLYLGLLSEKGSDIKIKDRTIRQLLFSNVKNAGNLSEFNNYIQGLFKQTTVIMNSIKNLETTDKDKLTFNDYYVFYNSVHDLVDIGAKIDKLYLFSSENLQISKSPAFNKYMGIFRTGENIALDITRRNYSSAISNIYIVLNYALQDKADTLNWLNTKRLLLRYGSFIAAIVQAENSDEVKAAIEAAALPAGSSSIKRNSACSIELNSYVGFYGGYESLYSSQPFKGGSFNTTGVTAPVGISFSMGSNNHSLSLFLSVFDLGTIASFRFKDDTTSQVPVIKLKHIVSPGVFFSWGIAGSPVSINAGIQIGPNLREVTAAENTFSDNMYWRTSLSVCVDIPIMSFYVRPKD